MRGNSHVRFGAGDEETCLGDEARRFIPTLPANPVRTLTLQGALRRPPRKRGCAGDRGAGQEEGFPPTAIPALRAHGSHSFREGVEPEGLERADASGKRATSATTALRPP